MSWRFVAVPEVASASVTLFHPASTEEAVDFLKFANKELRDPRIIYRSVGNEGSRTRWFCLTQDRGSTEIEYTLFIAEDADEVELLRLAGLELTETEGDEGT